MLTVSLISISISSSFLFSFFHSCRGLRLSLLFYEHAHCIFHWIAWCSIHHVISSASNVKHVHRVVLVAAAVLQGDTPIDRELCVVGLAAGLGFGALAEVTRRGLGIKKEGRD